MTEEARKPRRRRRPRPVEEAPPAETEALATRETETTARSTEETFPLRTSGNAAPVLILLAGIGASFFFGLASIGEPNTLSLFFAGMGLVGAGIGWAMLFGRQSILELTVGPSGAVISGSDRSSVAIPRGVLTEARVHTVTHRSSETTASGGSTTTTSVHYVVKLHKRDGGFIDLGWRSDEVDAERLARDITAALERFGGEPDAPSDPLAILRGSPLVRARRDEGSRTGNYRTSARDGALEVEWPLLPSHATVVPGIVAPLGLACALYGFHLQRGATVPLAFAWIFAALVPILLFGHALNIGRTQVLRVDDDGLSIEKRVGKRRTEHRLLPLDGITALDYSHEHDRIGGGLLSVRVDGEKRPELAVAAAAQHGFLAALRGLVTHMRGAIVVPLGRLSFGDKVRIDLAIGAEIARRTARDEQEL